MKAIVKEIKGKLMALKPTVKTPDGLRKFKAKQGNTNYIKFPARVKVSDLILKIHKGKIISVTYGGFGQFPKPEIIGDVSPEAQWVKDRDELDGKIILRCVECNMIKHIGCLITCSTYSEGKREYRPEFIVQCSQCETYH